MNLQFRQDTRIPAFNAKDHTYYHKDLGYYTSVSKFVEHFKEKFDEAYWLSYKAIEKVIIEVYGNEAWIDLKKKVGVHNIVKHYALSIATPVLNEKFEFYKQQIKEQWTKKNKESIEYGNDTHNNKEIQLEQFAITRQAYTSLTNPEIEWIPLWDLPDGIYTELKIWNNKHLICGKSDVVVIETIKNIRYTDVHDYKTNEKLDMTAYQAKKMKAPFSFLEDCKFNHYQVQLNMYQWLLSQHGFVPRKTTIEHTRENKIHEVKHFQEVIPKAIKQFKLAA